MMEEEIIAAAVCPQCGAPLTMIPETGEFKCEHCGVISLDKRHSFKHFTRDFDKEIEFHLQNADFLLSDGHYEKALVAYEKMTEEFGGDSRVWWGMAAACSKNFTDLVEQDKFEQVEKYYTAAITRADDLKRGEYERVFSKWKQQIEERDRRIYQAWRKREIAHKVKCGVFFGATILFLLFFWFICREIIYSYHPEYVSESVRKTPVDELIAFLAPPAVFTILIGIAALITKFPYPVACVNLCTVGSAAVFIGAFYVYTNQFKEYDMVGKIINSVVFLLLFALSTLVGRLISRAAAERY